MLVLRPYQDDAVKETLNLLVTLQHTSALIQASTGAGKTVIACAIIKHMVKEGKKVLILVKQQPLLTQFYDTLLSFDIKASVLHAEIKKDKNGNKFVLDWNNPVQLTMPTTFLNTDAGTNELYINKNWKPDLLVIDEAHKGTSKEFQEIRNLFNPQVLGLTASPYREKNEEGEHLTEWYGDRLVTTISMKKLMEQGDLVVPRYIEFDAGKGENEHMVETYKKEAFGKLAIAFTTTTEESIAVKNAFNNAGIKAEIITSGSDGVVQVTSQTPLQRQRIFNDFEAGRITVLVSCGALCEGFDCPPAEVCILFRNIGNHALYHQIVGRVLRPFEGKTSALVIDFRDNVKQYGYVEEWEWNLNHKPPVIGHVKNGEKVDRDEFKRRDATYYTCGTCNHVFNINKTVNCIHCNSRASYSLTTTKYKEVQKFAEWVKTPKDLKTLTDDIFERLETRDPVQKFIKLKRFNDVTKDNVGFVIFDLNTGNFLPEWMYLKDLLKKRISAEEEYEVAA